MIRKAIKSDINEIVDIAYNKWSDKFDISNRLKKEIYKFLIDYYFYINDYTLVFEENNIIYGFALASSYNAHNDADIKLLNRIESFSALEKEEANKYIKYINDNTLKVKELMNEDDIYFGLLASNKKGAGKELINELKRIVKSLNKKSLYFWTDETCNYKYYENEGFIKIKEYKTDFFGSIIKTFIYKIEL